MLKVYRIIVFLMSSVGSVAAQDIFTVSNSSISIPSHEIYVGDANHLLAGGAAMGLLAADDVNGISHNLAPGIGGADFAITFSVEGLDSSTNIGPEFISPALPVENVESQETRMQAGGDQFASTEAFGLGTGPIQGGASLGLNNNVLLINQSEWSPVWSGFRNRKLLPTANETQTNNPTNVDDVNGSSFGSIDGGVYFTLSTASPAINLPPGNAATVYFDPDPTTVSGDEVVYATFQQLDLSDDDDIDGLLVWDADSNGVYDGEDQIVFSLAADPGSPGGAELYVKPFASPMKSTFADAAVFGLDVDADVDALSAVALNGDSLEDALPAIAVPEPSSFWLLVFGALFWNRRAS